MASFGLKKVGSARRNGMAITVREAMNPELFSVRPEDRVEDALNGILALGITGAPVLDAEGHPRGMLSLRDFWTRSGPTAAERMTAPAVVVPMNATLAEAGRLLAETGYHRLVVVEPDGCAIGVVSSLDLVRALLGLPVTHPAAFPHLDRSRLAWSDDLPFEAAAFERAPAGPGVMLLIHGGASVPERIVWAESPENVRARLVDVLARPQRDLPLLAFWLARRPLRFRVAAIADADARQRTLERYRRQASLPEPWL
jgi:CBS domain-containing protein